MVLRGFMADWFLAAADWIRRGAIRLCKILLTITNQTLALSESDVRRGGSITLVYKIVL